MSDPSETPWSNHPDAPQIPSWLYLSEKEFFAGFLISAISYGIVVVLFFRCMGALLSPDNPMRRGTKWAFVSHTVAMFSFLSIPIGIDLHNLSILYINNRGFSGNNESPPGPLGYDEVPATSAIDTVFNIMFPLNQWLADGLLLHRCYLIYSMDRRAMAPPCLMYLASIAMGIAEAYQGSGITPDSVTAVNFNTSYLSISLSLNVTLTLMIVVRLIRHIRNLRKATGDLDGSSGLHAATATVVTMLIESYALYALAILLYLVPWAIDSSAFFLFPGVLGAAQVIAPYMIVLRVANRRALTSKSISGTAESLRFQSQGSMDSHGSLPDGEPIDSIGVGSEAPGELRTGDESAVEEVPLGQVIKGPR